MTEFCQFLGESWKVIINIQQLSQLLYTVNNRGWGLILSKNIPAEVEGSKKTQKNWKIFYFEPTSATAELKKEVNVRIYSKTKTKYWKFQKVTPPNNFFKEKISNKSLFWHFSVTFFLFCDTCTLEELLTASGQRKYKKIKYLGKCSFGGGFFGSKGAFSHWIPKKPANFTVWLCSQHISPHFLYLHMLCKQNCPADNNCFCNFFSNFFSRFCKNSYWFIYEII